MDWQKPMATWEALLWLKTVTEKVMTKPASKRVEVVPASFETVTENRLAKAASKRLTASETKFEPYKEQMEIKKLHEL